MITSVTTNQRLVTILLILLITLLGLLVLGIVARFLMMGGMMGMNGQMMNDVMSVCTNMMTSFQNP